MQYGDAQLLQSFGPNNCIMLLMMLMLIHLYPWLSKNQTMVLFRAQSTAAAALNTRLEEDMEAIRKVSK